MEINSNLVKRASSQQYRIGSKCNDRILGIIQVSMNNYNIIERLLSKESIMLRTQKVF